VVELAADLPTRPDVASRLAEFAAPAAGIAHDHDHGHGHDHGHEAEAGGIDPHVWLDPVLAQELVRRIADALVALAPEHAPRVHERRDVLLAELRQLDEEFHAALRDLPQRQLVTFHGAFAYLFARYELEVAGVIEPFPGDEPSAAYLRKLVGLMRELDLRTIFAEPQLPDRPAQVIAREIGGTVERLDPCETILADDPDATYLDRQRRNLETLRRVLGGATQP
jgi:zinc transport system substrate-binding protein